MEESNHRAVTVTEKLDILHADLFAHKATAIDKHNELNNYVNSNNKVAMKFINELLERVKNLETKLG